MSARKSKTPYLCALFASFMFLQFTVLSLANHTGEGFLSETQREWVYYVIQVLVVLGFLAFAFTWKLICRKHLQDAVTAAVLLLFGLAVAGMLFVRAPILSVITSAAAMLLLGSLGGMVYERMSRAAAAGARVARAMGLGCAIAVGLQYVVQIQWSLTPVMVCLMLAALLLLAALLRKFSAQGPSDAQKVEANVSPQRIVITCLIAAVFMLFIGFYNGYIHLLQIRSQYAYNAYSWPRLLMIPCYLLFAALGDWKRGKLVPLLALVVALAAMLNAVLTASADAYWLNMCLFYVAVAAMAAYYNLAFWRLAQRTRHPALWASVGRILDSVTVLAGGLLHISELPVVATLAVNLVGLAGVIVLMAVNGDFNFSTPANAPQAPDVLSEDAAIAQFKERYHLTEREAAVLQELVCSEDKQTVICDRLEIKLSTLQSYITHLYQKTGASTRAGLTDLYHRTVHGE